MKKYEEPMIVIMKLPKDDIITTSITDDKDNIGGPLVGWEDEET